ncbi:MAG: hypothetical protein A3I77_01080 [Gammaproteobacteria bacterium RIFCSPLOWO2_02_FULL_42_14]|nr:MAG: hypothetical protein A3B71_01510 [Gammaproteobacteria bacterium RIFCSPHIGHO2_02_FULL_42_43]OGT27360.1 MAG: hypothetical protein A2624_04855 [Gammaproteobacteria bacterium RIFCSPHIGHO2_01_FULL_42_8]OGT52655.1 MAG: hypothetical protein A3E54_07205 [Gammaproteobacteria bacterium RIFCSPHIGHO2_12_FULL_41_25]OGT62887.1 MAG: hypothetical protein A3I77_01080 [Gammaproteobacteria bacterium RIFCSPLOWO2_02_FULL_42_14]OGT86942.1 MAG: hypothetical protein A3G86_06380 [Gammaproteobacteria bacterium R
MKLRCHPARQREIHRKTQKNRHFLLFLTKKSKKMRLFVKNKLFFVRILKNLCYVDTEHFR